MNALTRYQRLGQGLGQPIAPGSEGRLPFVSGPEKVRQSIYQRDEAQDSLELTRRQITQNTLNYYNSVIAGISEVESGKAAVESAQKAVDATKAGFQVGTQIMLDVLTSINQLTQAQSTYSVARHQLVLNRLLLKQSAGTIDYNDLEYANSLLQ